MGLTLNEIREKSVPIAMKHGVDRLSLFGSYARGEATEKSDIDFFIHKGEVTDLIKYFSLVLDFEQTFGCHVDIVTSEISDQEFCRLIQNDEVVLYERSKSQS